MTMSLSISIGSCTFNIYFELDDVVCIGGILESEGIRLVRAVGDGTDDAEVEDLELHIEITGVIEGSVGHGVLRPKDDKSSKPG